MRIFAFVTILIVVPRIALLAGGQCEGATLTESIGVFMLVVGLFAKMIE